MVIMHVVERQEVGRELQEASFCIDARCVMRDAAVSCATGTRNCRGGSLVVWSSCEMMSCPSLGCR